MDSFLCFIYFTSLPGILTQYHQHRFSVKLRKQKESRAKSRLQSSTNIWRLSRFTIVCFHHKWNRNRLVHMVSLTRNWISEFSPWLQNNISIFAAEQASVPTQEKKALGNWEIWWYWRLNPLEKIPSYHLIIFSKFFYYTFSKIVVQCRSTYFCRSNPFPCGTIVQWKAFTLPCDYMLKLPCLCEM